MVASGIYQFSMEEVDWITDRGVCQSHQRNGGKEMIQLENVHKKLRPNQGFKEGLILQIQVQMMWLSWVLLDQGNQLLNVLSGLEKVDEGHILIQGQDLSQLTDAQLTAFRRERRLPLFSSRIIYCRI